MRHTGTATETRFPHTRRVARKPGSPRSEFVSPVPESELQAASRKLLALFPYPPSKSTMVARCFPYFQGGRYCKCDEIRDRSFSTVDKG